MKRLTQANAEELRDAADELASQASDLSRAIQEWIDAKEETGTEAREAAAMASDEIGSSVDAMEVALGDLDYVKER